MLPHTAYPMDPMHTHLEHADIGQQHFCILYVVECMLYVVCCGMQEHPDTVGGAMLTGVREAVRALRMLKGASEEEANAAAGGVDGGLPSRKRKQVRSSTCC